MIRTKIVCTIGPATREPAMLHQIIEAGMDVARLNLSHADHTYHTQTIANIRQAAREVGKTIAILGDLQGPKLRIGHMAKGGVEIKEGENIILTTKSVTGKRSARIKRSKIAATIPIQYKDLPKDIKPGERILIDDGLIDVKVMGASQDEIYCSVVTGGILTDNKGLNLPGTMLSLPAITDKDWEDLDFCLDQGIDWVALSFVRSEQDVLRLREVIDKRCDPVERVRVIAKIEKPQALEWINEIIAASDAIMIARGDLGIEIPPEHVPLVQKRLIQLCNAAAKPVITATQMLDSMIRNPRPTRAEASDVANAILDGTDAIMLSGETASGKYPLEAVTTMAKIAAEVENASLAGSWKAPAHITINHGDVTDAVSHATCDTAYDLRAAAILTATAAGNTARDLSKYRPHAPIMAATPNPTVARQLALTWGVMPVLSEKAMSTDQIVSDLVDLALHYDMAKEGDRVVITAGVATNMPGKTNMMTVQEVRHSGDPPR